MAEASELGNKVLGEYVSDGGDSQDKVLEPTPSCEKLLQPVSLTKPLLMVESIGFLFYNLR